MLCKLCNGDFKSLEMHLTTCLKKNNITREQYNLIGVETFSEVENPTEVKIEAQEIVGDLNRISQEQITKKIFDVDTSKYDLNKSIKDLLEEIKITPTEFFTILKQWQVGGIIPLKVRLDKKIEMGRTLAQKYKDKDKADITNLETAEILTKEFGFRCLEVRAAQGGKPKTWVLIKG